MVDKSFTVMGVISIILLTAALLVILAPIFARGTGAFVFKGTIEYRRVMLDQFGRGNRKGVEAEAAKAAEARKPVYDMISNYEEELKSLDVVSRLKAKKPLDALKDSLRALLGPFPGESRPALLRDQYGQARWDRAKVKLADVIHVASYDYSNSAKMGVKILSPRAKDFEGTSLEPLFGYIENNMSAMLLPRTTVYWRFLFDESYDAHFLGGIWPEVLGTLYLTIGAMLFAVPMGVVSAIFLVGYCGEARFISVLRTFISTLAGVPSIVFGLFGLAFFINTMHVSNSKSVLAGSLTLALLILPTVIRASEEAIKAVPVTYKEASLSCGASTWQTIIGVILPAALPGILTGIIISMGRAAGETAPIIFTAAVSVGKPLAVWQTLTEPTPALSWNIYNLATEHTAVEEIRHVQFGMVFALILLVLILNLTALILRARITKKLKG